MSKKSSIKPTPMTTQDAARIQSATARASGGEVKANSFTSRAQRAAATKQDKAAESK